MSNKNRMRRGLTDDPLCLSCGEEETSLHILRDCPNARRIWNAFPSQIFQQAYGDTTIQKRVATNMSKEFTDEITMCWPSTFTVTIWWLWRWRNQHCFGRQNDLLPRPFYFLMQRIEEVKHVMERDDFRDNTQVKYKEFFVRWLIPPNGELS